MATIREVAERARVSVGTVSNVLTGAVPVSDRLRQRVLAVVEELDYQPNQLARSLKIRQTRMIGLVISDISHPRFTHMMRGAEDTAWRQNYLLVMLDSDGNPEREQQILTALRTRRVDGILLAATGGGQIRSIGDWGVPIVCLERDVAGLGLDCVLADYFNGSRQCVRHLLSAGRRSIAFVRGHADDFLAGERFEGYRDAMLEAGLEADECRPEENGSALDAGYRAGMALFQRDVRPDAVIAGDAMLAAGVLRAFRDLHLRCPDDAAIASYDDPFSCDVLRPRLTAIAQPSYEMGAKAIGLLLDRILEPQRRCSKVTLDTILHVRESSGRSVVSSGAA